MHRFVLLLMVLIIGPSPASMTKAQDLQIDHATTIEAAVVSGIITDFSAEYDTGDGYAIGGLETAEVSNKPCRLGILRKNLNTSELISLTYGQQQIDLECPVDMLWEWIPSRKSVAFPRTNGKNSYVQGAAVCVNDNNGRIKGLRIIPGGIIPPLPLIDRVVHGSKAFERANCKEWKPTSLCPDDMIGSGVIAYMTEAHGLVGIRLKCSRLAGGLRHQAEDPNWTPPAREHNTVTCDDLDHLSWADQVAFSQRYSNSCQDEIEATWDDAATGGDGLFDMSGVYTMKVYDPQATLTLLAQTRVEIEQTGRQVLFKVNRGLGVWNLAEAYEMRGLAQQNRVLDVIGEEDDRIEAGFGRRIRGHLRLDNGSETLNHPIELTPVKN